MIWLYYNMHTARLAGFLDIDITPIFGLRITTQIDILKSVFTFEACKEREL